MQVNEPEQGNGVVALPLRASSPFANATAEYQDFDPEGAGLHESTSDVPPPPLGVELTGYRLLNMSVVFAFCLSKGILTYMGRSVMPTTLDWISGGVLIVILYWIGLYEPLHLKNWEWFFQVDLTRAICYCFLRFIGGVIDILFFSVQGTLALSSVPVFLLARFISGPRALFVIWIDVFIMFTICVHYALWKMRRLQQETRAWQVIMSFLEVYGLSASHPEKYEWSGSVGVTLGFFSGTALVCSPLTFVYSLSHD